jgi:hypothetical protein
VQEDGLVWRLQLKVAAFQVPTVITTVGTLFFIRYLWYNTFQLSVIQTGIFRKNETDGGYREKWNMHGVNGSLHVSWVRQRICAC